MVDLESSKQEDNCYRSNSSSAIHYCPSQVSVCKAIELDLSISTIEEKDKA